MNHQIGILGGYGSTGRLVAQELGKLPNVDVVLGGRKVTKIQDVLPSARTAVTDAFDPDSLKKFCRGLDVVINCTSPTCMIRDRVARAALDAGAHYIDPGGYETVFRSMKGRPTDRVCLISAGLAPGITELLMQDIVRRFDTPESVDFYMDGRAVMASSVFEDMIHTFFPLGVGSFEGGVATARNKWASKPFKFPKPIGKQRAVPMLWPEIEHFATTRRLPHLGFHVAATLPFLASKDLIHPLFKNRTRLGAKLLKTFYDLEISKYGDQYVFVVEADGKKSGKRAHITAEIVAKGNEHYRLTAVAIVVAAQMILGGEAAPGVHYLADAVDPSAFMQKLQPYGLPLRIEEQ